MWTRACRRIAHAATESSRRSRRDVKSAHEGEESGREARGESPLRSYFVLRGRVNLLDVENEKTRAHPRRRRDAKPALPRFVP